MVIAIGLIEPAAFFWAALFWRGKRRLAYLFRTVEGIIQDGTHGTPHNLSHLVQEAAAVLHHCACAWGERVSSECRENVVGKTKTDENGPSWAVELPPASFRVSIGEAYEQIGKQH